MQLEILYRGHGSLLLTTALPLNLQVFNAAQRWTSGPTHMKANAQCRPTSCGRSPNVNSYSAPFKTFPASFSPGVKKKATSVHRNIQLIIKPTLQWHHAQVLLEDICAFIVLFGRRQAFWMQHTRMCILEELDSLHNSRGTADEASCCHVWWGLWNKTNLPK